MDRPVSHSLAPDEPQLAAPAAETCLGLIHAATQALATESSVEAAAGKIIAMFRSALRWDYGALWHEDEQTHGLSSVLFQHADFLAGSDFIALTHDVSFLPVPGGLIRPVLESREPMFYEDIAKVPGLRRSEAAARAGLRSAIAFPLVAGGQALGALEFFDRRPRRSDQTTLMTAANLGALLGEFIARRQAEHHYRELVELSPDAIIVSCEGRYVLANRAAVQMLGGTDASQILGRDPFFLLHPDYERISRARVQQLYEGRSEAPRMELKFVRLDGTAIDVEVSSRYFVFGGKPAIQSIFRDVSARKRDERNILRLSNTYEALSRTNKALARLSTPAELFAEVCRIAVEQGRFALAGVMQLDDDGRTGRFVAAHGEHQAGLLQIHMDVQDGGPASMGPVATSVRSGQHCISNRFLDDPRTVFWRDMARRSGFRSGGAFPLRRGDRVIGALAVYSLESDVFDDVLTGLLDEMALNVSFGLDAIAHDDQRRAAESALQENERALSTLMRNLPGMAYRCGLDRHRTLEFASEGCLPLTGYRPEDLVDNRMISLADLVHPGDRGWVASEIAERLQNGDRYILEYQIVCADGTVKWISEKAQAIRDEDGVIVRLEGIIDDITDRKRSEERLAFLAQYDTLTGLPNRALFYERLGRAVARARREKNMVGLLFLDLDRFKQINDSLGHAAGDRVLKVVAERLKGFLREVDTIARLGGDEFTVIIEGVDDAEQVASVAEKIKSALGESVMLDGHDMLVSASIGITLYPRDADDIEHLIRNADIAMYHAKHRGGRQQFQFYDPGMAPLAAGQLEMEARLKRAIGNSEFVLHYQPTVDMHDGRITGMEALIHWQSPEGMITPSEFIPLAEESGLILDIGRWVLHTACAQAKAWQREGLPPLRLAVNISPLQFRQENLLGLVSEILRETGLAPDSLELEITESAIMDRSGHTIATLNRLEELGVHLSVDDFGTGYSSLAYLKQFPVHQLKIDRSFVRDVNIDADNAAIVSAMIAMSKNLGLQVTAEGVETRDQLEFLRKAGCDTYQGYYFSVPLPARAFAELIRKQADEDR
jgi:diguanylate cyclase (GGDEF)-like protein/PAS domain S-box-containing protein